jgi:DNA-binding transcriptional LysR family regulator
MELRHLRYFVAVAEAENVSRAALKLHVSQPAVSTQVRDLEDELGFDLLARTAKSVRLTEAGRVFLEEARAVLERAKVAVDKARAVANRGSSLLHIGYSPTPTAHLLPAILRAFQSAIPDARLKLHDQTNDENIAGLHDGRLQLAFVIRPLASKALRDLRFEELTQLASRLAVAPKHPFARRRLVTLADAVREPFVAYTREEYPDYHANLAAAFAATKGKPRIVEEHDGFSSLISAIEAGTGVALVSDSFAARTGTAAGGDGNRCVERAAKRRRGAILAMRQAGHRRVAKIDRLD